MIQEGMGLFQASCVRRAGEGGVPIIDRPEPHGRILDQSGGQAEMERDVGRREREKKKKRK